LEVHIPTHIHSMFSGALCFFQIQNEGLQWTGTDMCFCGYHP
jgi:hypothetical protein